MIFEFMKAFVDVLGAYLKSVEEESIKDNFVIIYELLDEAVDNGHIQCVDYNVLKEYIKTSYHELVKPSKNNPDAIREPQINKKITWRKEGIKHKENECFLDVIERIKLTVSVDGIVSRSEIEGVVKANSKLSGMPNVEMAFNTGRTLERVGGENLGVEFDDIKFHKCVDLPYYHNTNKVLFIPPDGQFELLNYYIKTNVKPLFSVAVETLFSSNTKYAYRLRLGSNFKASSTANDVKVLIPAPCDLLNPSFKAQEGKVDYLADKNCLAWSLPTFKGEDFYVLEYEYSLPTLVSRKINSQQRRLSSRAFEYRFRDTLFHDIWS